jgi:hypothetical protein
LGAKPPAEVAVNSEVFLNPSLTHLDPEKFVQELLLG